MKKAIDGFNQSAQKGDNGKQLAVSGQPMASGALVESMIQGDSPYDLIIPADERSGSATQAGVPEFIDDWLDFRGGHLLAEIRGGLTWLDMECNRRFNHDFADCADAERKQILDRIAYPDKAAPEDASAVAFFNQLRGLVVSGFFSSEMGVKDLPYLGNTMVAEWKGCPPEALKKLGLTGGEKT